VCEYEDWMAALKFCDIVLGERSEEFLMMKIFEMNSNFI
jgi:hypothetical protein